MFGMVENSREPGQGPGRGVRQVSGRFQAAFPHSGGNSSDHRPPAPRSVQTSGFQITGSRSLDSVRRFGILDLRWNTPKSSAWTENLADGNDEHWRDHIEGDAHRFDRT